MQRGLCWSVGRTRGVDRPFVSSLAFDIGELRYTTRFRSGRCERRTCSIEVMSMRTRARSNYLSRLRIREPCQEPWEAMPGTDQERSCARCNKQVHNLSAMSREAAEALLA